MILLKSASGIHHIIWNWIEMFVRSSSRRRHVILGLTEEEKKVNNGKQVNCSKFDTYGREWVV